MDPEQLVAQLAELRTQNQQLHQALQQVQQQQSQQQGLVQALSDQLYTVLMTLVEGESFDILVGSGSGEGLEAWRRLHKRWDP